ncbi:MAG: hypothetical protein LBU65_07915 [Planctomycetaceae bacterium]|jgi:hypothetical protein|nr:hypothetical protein [Planctomycetaceae bacterium]
MNFQYKSLAVTGTSLFNRSLYRLLLSVVVLTVVLVSSLYAQPSYRNKQDQLLGQSNRNTDKNKPSTEKPRSLNLRNPENLEMYTGKDTNKQPVQSSAVEDRLNAVREGLSKSRSTDSLNIYGATIFAAVVLTTLIIGLVLYKYYKPIIDNLHIGTGYGNPRELFNKLCEVHGIDQKNQTLLKSLAERLEIVNVLLLFIEPQFLQQALDNPNFLADHRRIQNLQQVLFGEYGTDAEDSTTQNRSKLRVEMSSKEAPTQNSALPNASTIMYPPQPKKQEPKQTLFQTINLNSFTETVTNLVKLLHNKLTVTPTRPDTLTYRPERASIPIEETNLAQLFYEPLPDGSKLEKFLGR